MRIYETAAALATETLTPGQLVMTKGQAAAGDGLAGLFRIVSAATYAGVVETDFDVTLADTNVAHFQRPYTLDGHTALGAVSGSVGLDCQDGFIGSFSLSTSGDITDITVANVPQHDNIATGIVIFIDIGATPDAITFGAEFVWSGGSAPAFDTPSTKEVVVAYTFDKGVTWYATLALQGLV